MLSKPSNSEYSRHTAESAAGARLPPALSAFHAQHPDVPIEPHIETTAALLRLLDRFDIEAAFVSKPLTEGQPASSTGKSDASRLQGYCNSRLRHHRKCMLTSVRNPITANSTVKITPCLPAG